MADNQTNDTPDIGTLKGDDRQRAAYQYFIGKGWSPPQAAGIVGGLKGETANLNPIQTHDNGRGLGIAGWNGDRLTGLMQFAGTQGKSPTDLQTQLDYVDHELRTSESGAGNLISAATTPEQAGQATLAYFRPSNWNLPGAHPERAQAAGQFYKTFNPPQTAQDAISKAISPSSAPGGQKQALSFAEQPDDDAMINQWRSPKASSAPQQPQGESDDDILGAWRSKSQAAPPAVSAAPVSLSQLPSVAAPQPAPGTPNLPGYVDRLEAGHQGDDWTDRAIRFGGGVMRGVGDVGDTLAQGIAATGDKGAGLLAKLGVISPQTAQGVTDWRTGVNAGITQNNQGFDKAAGDSGLASTGRVGGEILGTAPFLAPLAAALPEAAAARTFASGGNLAQAGPVANLLRTVAQGAGVGAGANVLTSSTSPETIGTQAIEGGLTGALLGPAGKALSGAGEKLYGLLPSVKPEIAALAQTARDKYGINLTRQQLTRGFGPPTQDQMGALERSIAGEMGNTTGRVTPGTVADTLDSLRQNYKQLHATWGPIPADQTFQTSLSRVEGGTDSNKVKQVISDIRSSVDPKTGFIDSDDYARLTNADSDLAKIKAGKYGSGAQGDAMAVENAFDRIAKSSNPTNFAQKKLTDQRFAVAKTAQEALGSSPIGELTPQTLWTHFGKGEWDNVPGVSDPAKIAKQFMGNEPLRPSALKEAAKAHGLQLAGAAAAGAAGVGGFDPDNWQRDLALGGGVLGLIAAGRFAPYALSRPNGIIARSLPGYLGGGSNKLLDLLRTTTQGSPLLAPALRSVPNINIPVRPGYYSQPSP